MERALHQLVKSETLACAVRAADLRLRLHRVHLGVVFLVPLPVR